MTPDDWSRATDRPSRPNKLKRTDALDSTVIASTSRARPRDTGRTQATHHGHGTLEGEYLGVYWLKELLGVGGMAKVYRARDLTRQRVVAVKVLDSHLGDDASYTSQFRDEARRAARLRHPHVVPIFDMGEDTIGDQRVLYLVMPLLGLSLHQRLRRDGALPYPEAIRLALETADGLQATHAAGLVHCDVKPGNILLDAKGHAHLCDFGVALEIAGEAAPQPSPVAAPDSPAPARSASQDKEDWVAGTPAYMAPEQLCGGAVDQRVDVYSLGVVLYQLLTGQRPFNGETPLEIATHALHDPIIPPTTLAPERALPLGLDRVLLTAMARDPHDRFNSIDEFAVALRRVRADPDGLWDARASWDIAERWPIAAAPGPSIPHESVAPWAARDQRARGVQFNHARRLLCVAALAASLACAVGLTTMLQTWGEAGNTSGGVGLLRAVPATEVRDQARQPGIVITQQTPTPTTTPSNVGGGPSDAGEVALVSAAPPVERHNPHGHGHSGKGKKPPRTDVAPHPQGNHSGKPAADKHAGQSQHGNGHGHQSHH